MKNFRPVVMILFCVAAANLSGQSVYEHVSNTAIYSFLDEMANEGYIQLNSAVKPYTRLFIARELARLRDSVTTLNARQQAELNFYLRDYNKELLPGKAYKKRFDVFYHKDSLFTFSVNPILGLQLWHNENGNNYHRWNGADIFAYVKHLGIYASLRDNHDEKELSGPQYLDTRPGAVYKSGQDYSEMRGGITWDWKWGMIGLVKDHVEWGNNYHYPSILSAKVPSFAMIRLSLNPVKWFSFNYLHGWLVSGVVDSSRSYYFTNAYGTTYREVFRPKYIAANLFTFRPWKGLYTSIGNSIVYSDYNPQPGYLIPVFLYKSVDHTNSNASANNYGQNSQFFIDLSSRQIRHLHLYATLFFDDVSIARLRKNGHLDYYSLNAGFQVSDLIPNSFFTLEYFQSYPLVYKHNMPTTTYESNFYNLGHYLQDNSRAIYLELTTRPIRGLTVKASYDHAVHGRDFNALGTDRTEVVHLFLDTIKWRTVIVSLDVNYQIWNDIYVFAGYSYQLPKGEIEKYTAPYFRGKTNTFTFGVNYGF